jgi:nucleotide-binding universal stress UspA family protein
MLKIRRILFPTDFSQNATAALSYAQWLAEQTNAELHLLHVLEDVGYVIPSAKLIATWPIEAFRAAAAKSLETVVDAEWARKHPPIRVIREGSAFLEILRYAREMDIDLIVMSTHGRTGLSHLMMGSVAENVVRKSACPVLTVHPAGHKFIAP